MVNPGPTCERLRSLFRAEVIEHQPHRLKPVSGSFDISGTGCLNGMGASPFVAQVNWKTNDALESTYAALTHSRSRSSEDARNEDPLLAPKTAPVSPDKGRNTKRWRIRSCKSRKQTQAEA
jgi:hypothetical protein